MNTAPRPNPIANIMPQSPAMIPMRYGMDFFRPKLTPEESKKVLFGPGVTDVTKLKIAAESKRPAVMFRV